MVDEFDEHGPSGPHPDPAPPGDLPPDLFDDPAAPRPSPPATAGPAAPGSEFPPPTPSEEPRPGHPIFPVVLGFAMLAALAVAMVTNLNAAKEPPPAAATSTPATATAAAPSSAPADEAAGDVKAIKAQLDDLSAQLKDLQAKVEGMPKAASREDLEKVQAKVDELSKAPAPDEALPKKVAALDDRVGALDKTLAELRDEVGALRGEVKKAGEAAAPAAARPEPVAEAARPADVDVEGQALSQGAELYEAGKYKEASDAFRKVTEAAPDDARGWYFAALSNGMATNQWRGETERLVNKGVEREKAGTPESSKIDPLFAKLPAKQKTWLDYYRQFAKKR
jgi:TolA-binding protein